MVSALILVFALAAMAHFAVSYWRALLLSIAAEPLSERVHQASGVEGEPKAADFDAMLAVFHMCPELGKKRNRLGLVTLYYRALAALKSVGRGVPTISLWAEREMSTCTRFVAVTVDHRLQHNLDAAAAIRSL